jgi:hypothetical protein
MLYRILTCIYFQLFSVLVIFAIWFHQNKEINIPESVIATKWNRYCDHLKRQPDLVAFYSFQDEHLDGGKIRNRKSAFPTTKLDLDLSQRKTTGRIVEGHWPNKQAIELDRDYIRLPANGLTKDTFTISMWVRHNGCGSLPSQNIDGVATIICLSDGIWSGWRIDLLFPSNRAVFHISRGKPLASVGVTSSFRIPPKTWTHLGVTRDKTRIRIYENGLLAGETLHNATPTQIQPYEAIKFGYAGNGLGSALIQIDELTFWSTAKSDDYFLWASLNRPPPSDSHSQSLKMASEAFAKNELRSALKYYHNCAHYLRSHPDANAVIALRIQELYRETGETDKAMAICEQLFQNTKIPLNIRHLALHDFLMIKEGTTVETEPSHRSMTMNYQPIYNDLVPASREYSNTCIEYDFLIPIHSDSQIDLNTGNNNQ